MINLNGIKKDTIKIDRCKLLLFQRMVVDWYDANGRDFPWRKKAISTYQKIIVEILLQRTRAEKVASFFPAFIRRFDDWSTLANAAEHDLQQFLKPIGLWRRRSQSLIALSQVMVKTGGHFPRTRDEIESLPSVGQYIANAILLFCFGESQPLLDAGMARVLERVFGKRKLADIRYDPYLQQLAREIVAAPDPIKINWAILDLSSLLCKSRNPKCTLCPINEMCQHSIVNY